MGQAEARKKLKELVAALGGQAAASRAMEAAGTPIRADSIKRLLRGERAVSDQLLLEMEAIVGDRPRWLLARSGHEKWVVHLHHPPFAAKFVDGEPAEVQWFADQPPARVNGDLIKQAREFLLS